MNEILTIIKENFLLLYIAMFILPLLFAVVYFFKNKNSFIYSAMFTKKLQRVSPAPGNIKYKLCNGKLECFQQELTIAEDDAIMRLLENFSFEEVKDGTLQIKTVIAFLVKNKALIKFIRIILHIADDIPDSVITQITNSELQVVINDFFTLNPGAFTLLKNLQMLSGISSMMNLKNSMDQNSSKSDGTEQKK